MEIMDTEESRVKYVKCRDAGSSGSHETCHASRNVLRWAWGLTKEQLPVDLRTDCESLVGAIATTKTLDDPRIGVQVQALREAIEFEDLRTVKHICGKTNPADIFTKQTDVKIRGIVHHIMRSGQVQDLR